ncbi:MAG: hypothetical protein LUH49_04080 [Cloacibacillus porcorum]|uniref:hypothetical protein n=1 Tax=Cloacibacillus porcorum TaxID=1197717 RepID=UPI0023F3D113|nr:hypothetical protein [Cloacibacillus porcorum]MCD7876139.1 hypothetical protein [Cloacibacillus porcorum]
MNPPEVTYDRLTSADPVRISRAMMSIQNSLSDYTPEEKLLAASAVCEAMLQAAQTTMDISLTDLRTIISNMSKKQTAKTSIAEKTIERMILK